MKRIQIGVFACLLGSVLWFVWHCKSVDRTLNILPITPQEREAIQKIGESSKDYLLVQAFTEEKAFRLASYKVLMLLSQSVAEAYQERVQADGKCFQQQLKRDCITQISNDLKIVEKLGDYKGLEGNTYSFETHKLREILKETKRFVQKNFNDLVTHNWMKKYPVDFQKICLMGGQKDSKYNFEDIQGSMVALNIRSALIVLDHLLQKRFFQLCPMGENPLVHATALPNKLFEQKRVDLKNFTWLYKDENLPGELMYPHQGYAMRGYVDDKKYFYDGVAKKAFGPIDCSAWICQLIGSKSLAATAHFYALFNRKFSLGQTRFEREKDNVMLEDLAQCVEPVKVDNIGDLKPGMIVAFRTFDTDEDPRMEGLGNSGHIALVIQATKTELIVLERTRHLPMYSGFGLRKIPFKTPNKNTRQFYFKFSRNLAQTNKN